MVSELIVDRTTGAETVKFSEMTDEELRRRSVAFPEARQELAKRVVAGL